MSTTIIPDIYRHTARKSTVSRNVKPPSKNVSLCNSTFNNDNNSKEEPSIFDTIQCDIKLEKEISQCEQSLIILQDNEIEQMNIEQTNDEIIYDIVEQIKNQIPEYFTNQMQNSNQRRTISTDVHNVIGSLMNHINGNDNEQSINTINDESISATNDVHMEDVIRSANEEVSMESNQQSLILSRSQIDADIVEIEASRSHTQSQLCTCQCHQPISNSLLINPNSEYLSFEQALRQTRQEQQQEFSLNNNHLTQTLKRQHQELMNLYHRQLHINKIDREQQTIQINQHDSQIQTDLSATQQQNYKPTPHQVNGTHSTPNTKGSTATAPRPFNSFLTPIRTTGPSLQQLIPCLTTTTTATTTTLINKTSMIKKMAPAATANSHTSPLPPPLSAPVSHDVVDLTEEDDDDSANRVPTQKISPVKPQKSPASTSSLATAATTRNQLTNRPVRPNTTVPLGQTFPMRPLPEYNPCDYTIARPQLSITHDNTTVRLTWNLLLTPMESIQNYEIYAYKQNAALTTSDWKKIGTVNSMRLPMAVTLKEFQSNSHYAFAVRAISINNNIGPFCEPKTIFTGNTLIQPLSTNQILDAST